jgi:hypothetical protein
MREECDDVVSVLASFAPGPRGSVHVAPQVLEWRGRRFRLTTMGLHHPERRGRKYVHVFGFACGEVGFRVELDSETLEWRLTEVFYGT